MLSISTQATYQDGTGNDWVYYQDDTQSNVFYIVPSVQFIMDDAGNPSFSIVTYLTDDSNNGSGVVTIGVELSVSAAIESAISAQIANQLSISNAQFNALQYNPGSMAYLNFVTGSQTIQYAAAATQFGSNQATFVLQLNATQLQSLVAQFSQTGATYQVQYTLTVPARMPGVTAVLSFNSTIAYQYQVSQPTYNGWGDQTSPGSVQELLQSSESSSVSITPGSVTLPPQIETAVTVWANTTIADLVSAAVQQQMQIQGETSSDSFSINTISSFTSNFSESQVISWSIQPQATLPSIPTLGLSIGNFTSTVNDLQQVMTVTCDVPFSAASAGLPAQMQAALVQQVAVTVTYPGLTQANSTYTFTSNGSQVFSAPYDETQGGNWSLQYTVTYASQSTPQLQATVNVPSAQYAIDPQAIGFFTVTYDATNAFASPDPPTSVDIDLSFVNPDGTGSVSQQTSIDAGADPLTATITSFVPVPIDAAYAFTITYNYAGGTSFTAPTQTNQTGFLQYIPAAGAPQQVWFFCAPPTSGQIVNASVNVWYPQPPTAPPGATALPTPAAPTRLTVTPSGTSWGSQEFAALLFSDQPLMYSASVMASSGPPFNVDQQMLDPTLPSVQIAPNVGYFTIVLDASALDWSSTYSQVAVAVTAKLTPASTSNPEPGTTTFYWNTGQSGPQYMSFSYTPGTQTIAYTWIASYVPIVQQGQTPPPVATATGSATSTQPTLIIPAEPT